MWDVGSTTSELRRAIETGPPIALVPIASIEQHGPHLPVGTDWFIGSAVARAVAERLNAFLLPTLPFGTAQEHSPSAGTISFRQQTLFAVVKDVLASLRNQGFRRAVVMSSHGGNWIIKPAVREFNLDHRDFHALWVAPHDVAVPRLREIFSTANEVHAGEFETSVMLHLKEDTVAMDRAVDYIPEVGQEFLDYVGALGVLPDGVWGRSSLAAADKGRRAMEAMVEATVRYISETFSRLDALARESDNGEKGGTNR